MTNGTNLPASLDPLRTAMCVEYALASWIPPSPFFRPLYLPPSFFLDPIHLVSLRLIYLSDRRDSGEIERRKMTAPGDALSLVVQNLRPGEYIRKERN